MLEETCVHELLAESWRQLQCRLRPQKFKPCSSVSTTTSRKCTKSAPRQVHIHEHAMCERRNMASLSAAASSSEFCGSKLLLASLDPRPISHASETCCDSWETAVAPLEPPPMPSACVNGQNQSQSQKERSRACDVRNVTAVSRRHISCRGVANSPVGWLVRQKVAAFFFFEKRDGAEKMFGTLYPSEEGRRSIVAFAAAVGN